MNVLLRVPDLVSLAHEASHGHSDVRHQLQATGEGLCDIRLPDLHEGHLALPGAGGQGGRRHPHQLAPLHPREVGDIVTIIRFHLKRLAERKCTFHCLIKILLMHKLKFLSLDKSRTGLR